MPFFSLLRLPLRQVSIALALALPWPWAAGAAWAQASCSSDGQTPPQALLERFINADCAACWSDPKTTRAKPGDMALDWIAPSARGDNAPLSAVASRDALQRLESLHREAPAADDSRRRQLPAKPLALRVAHGLALNAYMGASIELKAAPGRALPSGLLTAWLVMVETIPQGAENTPVPRNIVRNALMSSWSINSLLSNSKQTKFLESRPMRIPEGANPDHLRVLGWVENAHGDVIASAASLCAKPTPSP